jgi:tetratricopeptide (TPR) repeat protein
MTASRRRRIARCLLPLAAGLASTVLGGCRTPGAAPRGSALMRDLHHAVIVPDVADHTAADVAAAALVSDRSEAQLALERLEAVDTVLVSSEALPTGLVAASQDLVNATLDDPRAYREATRELLDDGALDKALRERLDLVAADDPLLLARARMRDSYVISFGRAFNAVSEPLGQSIMNTSMAPYRLGRALIAYAAEVYRADPLPLQERQALVHWKTYLEHYPDALEAPQLQRRVSKAEAEWLRTQRKKTLRVAKAALDRGQIRLALVYADRALDYVPEDREASKLRDVATAQLRQQRADRARSLSSGEGGDVAPGEMLPLSHALLLPDGDVVSTADAILAADPDGPLADEATFALAIARGEAGDEDEKWDLIEDLSERDVADVNMARHAEALYLNPEENAYRAFGRATRRNVLDNAMWVAVGPFYRGLPDRGLPRPVSWVMDAPSVAESVMGSPVRLIQLPWMKSLPSARIAAHHGQRYLERTPGGEHSEEVSEWVESFEKKRGNWLAAYRIAERRPGVTIEELDEYREKAAEQALNSARGADRRDVRLTALRSVAQEFADTEAGREAGHAIRTEISAATPHRIRISRGFLLENPEVAGPAGIGIRPELLDDNAANSELHPEGMALLGGSEVAFYYVGPSGDDGDPPLVVNESIDEQRLARLVSAIQEASFENSLTDEDDIIEADAQRDAFFERARLGLATDSDHRPTATADYAYRGMRERYGMVRSRKPILPFDLVIKGSLTDFTVGAFPRIRKPRETPDAFLYR